jgi:hypothetical protein
MRKLHLLLIVAAALSMQSVFADDGVGTPADTSGGTPCASIANACLAAGFERTATEGKQFWQDCMKPVILGKTVGNVTIDSATVKACRVDKIAEMKKELKELQKSNASTS